MLPVPLTAGVVQVYVIVPPVLYQFVTDPVNVLVLKYMMQFRTVPAVMYRPPTADAEFFSDVFPLIVQLSTVPAPFMKTPPAPAAAVELSAIRQFCNVPGAYKYTPPG